MTLLILSVLAVLAVVVAAAAEMSWVRRRARMAAAGQAQVVVRWPDEPSLRKWKPGILRQDADDLPKVFPLALRRFGPRELSQVVLKGSRRPTLWERSMYQLAIVLLGDSSQGQMELGLLNLDDEEIVSALFAR